MAKTKLVLWDIDGTLIRGARSASQAFLATLRTVFALGPELKGMSFAGKTDAQIARELLSNHDVDNGLIDARLDAFHMLYVQEFQQRAAQLHAEIQILPGVQALLQLLQPRTVQALLTGNFEAGARLKLDAAGLSHFFMWECSAFGSDHEQRNQLVPIALERARSLGYAISPANTVVVGDTPFDIACAHAGGARAIAVATGSFDHAALAQAEPDALLDNLADLQQVLAALEISSAD